MSHKMEGVCCYVPQFNYNGCLEATPISARSHCVNYPITYNYTYTQSPRLSSPPSSPQPTTATSIDCRSLPKTSDLVAKFEKNIQEYRTRRSPRRRREIAKEEHSGGVQRVESFTLRQRAKVHSPLRNTGNLSSSEEFRSPVRLRSTLVGHQDLCDPVKRSSCGLRIACPSAKPALVGGLKSTTDSAYSSYFSPSLYSSSLNTPESWRVNSSITNHSELLDLSSDFYISPDIRSSKVEPMTPVTVVTTSTSDSYRQNKGIIREISTPMSPISANDSGAETMTSMNSIVASSDSTPTQERFLCSDYAPESGTTTHPSQIYQSTVHRSYKARIPLNVMTERVPHRGEGDIPLIHPGNTNPSTTTSGLRTPLSVIRKTRFSGLKFCGLSKTSWSKSKDKNRDPYIPSPSHTPSTPEVTHYKVFKPKSAASKVSGRCSSDDQLDSVPPRQTSEMQRRVGNGRPSVVTSLFDTSSRRGPGKTKMGTSMLNASHQEIKVGHEQEGNSITNKDRSTRRGQSVDSNMGHSERKATDSHQGRREENANRMLHKKAMSFTSDEELSVGTTTVDDDCELASIPDSVSSRGHRGALNRLSTNSSIRSNLSLKTQTNSTHRHQNHHARTHSQRMTLSSQNKDGIQGEMLIGNGASVDEETFQKVMGELQDMRLLLSSLMRHMTIQSTSSGVPSSGSNGAGGMSVSASMVPSGLDSPSADNISRAELLRRFNVASAFDPRLFQDASTQTTTPESTGTISYSKESYELSESAILNFTNN